MDTNTAIDAFAALAHAGRVAIFRLLVRAGPEGIPAGEIAAAVGQKQNTASVNLASLERAGLVAGTRTGRSVRYHVDFAQAGALAAFLLEECCAGHREAYAPLNAAQRCMPNAVTEKSDNA